MRTHEMFICTDRSKYLEVFRRDDVQGNFAGGVKCFEGGPRFVAAFSQAEGRRLTEALASIYGGEVSWGFSEMQRAQS